MPSAVEVGSVVGGMEVDGFSGWGVGMTTSSGEDVCGCDRSGCESSGGGGVLIVVVGAMGSEKELEWMGWMECVVGFRRKRYLLSKV